MPDSDEEDPAKIALMKAQSFDEMDTMPMQLDTQVFANALMSEDDSEKNQVEPKDDSAFIEFLKVTPPKKVGCLMYCTCCCCFCLKGDDGTTFS